MSSSSQEPSAQKTNSRLQNADPSNLGRSPPEGNKDHLLSQARSEIMKQEHQVESLNDCISELQRQGLCSRIGITGRTTRFFLNSTRTVSSTRIIVDEGKGSPRYSNPKHARDGRNGKSSRITS